MNINLVSFGSFYVSFDIESVNDEIMIVASIIRNGIVLHKVHKLTYKGKGNCELISLLLDRTVASLVADDVIRTAINIGVELV